MKCEFLLYFPFNNFWLHVLESIMLVSTKTSIFLVHGCHSISCHFCWASSERLSIIVEDILQSWIMTSIEIQWGETKQYFINSSIACKWSPNEKNSIHLSINSRLWLPFGFDKLCYMHCEFFFFSFYFSKIKKIHYEF